LRQPKEIILDALNRYQGDDLERAEMAFRHLSDKDLDLQHGESGKTRRQILEGYRAERLEIKNAIMWANTL
jgi:hypothetical protein